MHSQAASAHHEEDDAEDDDGQGHNDKDNSQTSAKGAVTITFKDAKKLLPMDTFTGKADPFLRVSVDGVTQKTGVRSGTIEPSFNETMQFNCFANRSIVRVDVMDAEAMGQDRPMGHFSFVVPPNPITQNMKHQLIGQLNDGRVAQGQVNLSIAFIRGAKVTKSIEQMTEFQIFCQTESYQDLFSWMMFWLRPSRRIEKAFYKVPLQVHEREFIKAVGSLSVPLTGLAIKQYLTYLLVEHSHAVDVYSCREFCRFFKRKLDDETSIRYRDIVTLIKERNSGVNQDDLFIGSILNPHHWLLVVEDFVARMVALYHFLMVRLPICSSAKRPSHGCTCASVPVPLHT